MNIAKEIVKYLDANLNSLTVGQNLFLGFIPLTKNTGVVISEAGGYENNTNMLRIQLHIAAVFDDYTTAENKCAEVYNKLVYSNGFNIDSGYVFNCVPINTPTYVGLTDEQKVLVTASVVLYKEK